MNRSTVTIVLAALFGAAIGFTVAPRDSSPNIPICFSYHGNKSVETFEIPTSTTCPAGYKYGRGTISNTTDLITILESVATQNFKNGMESGKSIAKK